jgi:hypothetical protein
MLTTRIFVFHTAIRLIEVPASAFICLRERNRNAKATNIKAITEQNLAIYSKASVNASHAMGRASFWLLSLIDQPCLL